MSERAKIEKAFVIKRHDHAIPKNQRCFPNQSRGIFDDHAENLQSFRTRSTNVFLQSN